MEWCVYVGSKAERNYKLGMSQGVWGQKNVFSTSELTSIRAGDRVLFIHNFSREIPPVGNERPGNIRLASENFERLGGHAEEVTVCEVTRDYYYDTTQVWPDSDYPHRYDFEIIEVLSNVLMGVEVQGEHFIRALLQSITRKGDAIPLGEISVDLNGTDSDEEESEDVATEGRPLYQMHRTRERNSKIVALKKQQALKENNLKCEACGFDFKEAYGARGEGFIECHHDTPLFEPSRHQNTRLDDLSLVCSNCHKMIHRTKRWLTVQELKGIINR